MEKEELSEKERKALLKAQRKAEFEAKFQKEGLKSKDLNSGKSKAELKAERRAKQDAQRAAKAEAKVSQTQTAELNINNKENKVIKIEPAVTEEKHKETATVITTPKELPKRLFTHLPQRVFDLSQLPVRSIPPEILQIGYRINKELIKGSTAKCVAMLLAFKSAINEHQLASGTKKDLKRDLQTLLFNDCLKFLAKCRPLSISMNNAVKHLKLVFSRLPPECPDQEVKERICSAIDIFINDEILCSWKAIVDLSLEKINDGDTILTLGCSTIVKHVLFNAAKQGKKFKVIVIDTRPRFEGREMLQFLIQNKIPATYILINSIAYVMKEVTKVIIEAHSLLGNGYVMSHMGSSQVSLVAKAYNVPVIVCCETYKFSERVHTDCFVHNELGNDTSSFFSSLGKQSPLDHCASLYVLDLLYDLTPPQFVSVVITEKGMLPCTSVPAILRVRETK